MHMQSHQTQKTHCIWQGHKQEFICVKFFAGHTLEYFRAQSRSFVEISSVSIITCTQYLLIYWLWWVNWRPYCLCQDGLRKVASAFGWRKQNSYMAVLWPKLVMVTHWSLYDPAVVSTNLFIRSYSTQKGSFAYSFLLCADPSTATNHAYDGKV